MNSSFARLSLLTVLLTVFTVSPLKGAAAESLGHVEWTCANYNTGDDHATGIVPIRRAIG